MANNTKFLRKFKMGREKQVDKIREKNQDNERLRDNSQGFSSEDVLGFWWMKLFGIYGPPVHLSHNKSLTQVLLVLSQI